MDAHTMYRYTVVAPHVDNDGVMSCYPQKLREALLDVGIDSWTEHETVGYWRAKREAGVTFEILRVNAAGLSTGLFAHLLGGLARDCMPDQEAIQVTCDAVATTVWEA